MPAAPSSSLTAPELNAAATLAPELTIVVLADPEFIRSTPTVPELTTPVPTATPAAPEPVAAATTASGFVLAAFQRPITSLLHLCPRCPGSPRDDDHLVRVLIFLK